MNKWRYRLTMTVLALIASPLGMYLGSLFGKISNAVQSAMSEKGISLDAWYIPRLLRADDFAYSSFGDFLNTTLPQYLFGLLPTLFILIYTSRIVHKNRKFNARFAWIITSTLAVLPLLVMVLYAAISHPERLSGKQGEKETLEFLFDFLLPSILAASATFWLLLYVGKKWLQKAGILLGQPSSEGSTP